MAVLISDLDDDLKNDPLAAITAPPPDESDADKLDRIRKENEAKSRSDAIDNELKKALAHRKKKRYKVLLLGQSESGKSTTLKYFQLAHSPRQFKVERPSWRCVIYFNIARSICLIVTAIDQADRHDVYPHPHPSGSSSSQESLSLSELSSPAPSSHASIASVSITDAHRELVSRLRPLQEVETRLRERLSAKGETEATSTGRRSRSHELAVRATSGWKSVTGHTRSSGWSLKGETASAAEREREKAFEAEMVEEEAIASQLRDARADIEALWNDPIIKNLRAVRKLRLEEMPGFFLDCLERTTASDYVPSDDDVLRARLKTLGVTEHTFVMNNLTPFSSPEWVIYDVGGTRCQREFWVPYFEDMQAIIFLAALSSFDQALVEDPKVNRLEDSLKLWKFICKNPLLKKCEIVLFLNKLDLFEKKLQSGIRFSKFVKSYSTPGLNDSFTVGNYLRRKFEMIHKSFSQPPRQFYCHMTSMMDVQGTKQILRSVTDMILLKSIDRSTLV